MGFLLFEFCVEQVLRRRLRMSLEGSLEALLTKQRRRNSFSHKLIPHYIPNTASTSYKTPIYDFMHTSVRFEKASVILTARMEYSSAYSDSLLQP